MNITEKYQCPNCWGFQEYDGGYSERQLCSVKSKI